jgi:DNA (cytosine-5)-methyltransferase 1
MKILNLYAGIGGNRWIWGEQHDITAVELNPETARIYQHFNPDDTVIVGDAHQYLLDHYSEFDFIWSSPPCPSHSKLNIPLHRRGYIRYPDMTLYQEIIFLKQWGRDLKWVIENVEPYYKPLIHAQLIIERHLLWANFDIAPLTLPPLGDLMNPPWRGLQKLIGIELPATSATPFEKRLMLRDITRPEIGMHILKAAMRETKQEILL